MSTINQFEADYLFRQFIEADCQPFLSRCLKIVNHKTISREIQLARVDFKLRVVQECTSSPHDCTILSLQRSAWIAYSKSFWRMVALLVPGVEIVLLIPGEGDAKQGEAL